MKNQICAIIPALNEEGTIGAVVTNLLQDRITRVFVVDNGSSDQTTTRAQEAGATVISEPQRGYGKACLAGMAALPQDCEWVLFCDADGSDDLSDLSPFWAALGRSDFILGNRRATEAGRGNLTAVQNFGNWLSGFLMKLGWGTGFSDLGPLRLIRRDALSALQMQDENFGWTVEMQAKALDQNLRFTEIPVNYLPRQGGTSKISGNFKASCQAGTIILSTLGMLWLKRAATQRALMFLGVLTLLLGAAVMGLRGDPASAEKGAFFFLGAGFMITGFLLACLRGNWSWVWLFSVAVLARLLLLPMPPGDDVWRYIWEGLIQTEGHNPYNTPPLAAELTPLRTEWWHLINHPHVTAIYPPLAQLIFKAMASLSPTVLAYKILFTLADLATGGLLLKRYGSRAALYLLNPMVIYCFAGGAHYESLFLLPLVLAGLMWEKLPRSAPSRDWPQPALIGLLVGASISIKIVALLAGGFIGWRLITRMYESRKIPLGLLSYAAALCLAPLFSYLIFSLLHGRPDSLYPRDFTEIARNTSLIPWLVERIINHPYDHIKNASFIPPLVLLLIPITLFTKQLSTFVSRSLLALFIFSPMIHAWYLVWAIPFALRRHTWTIIGLSISGFIYFLYPYRFASTGVWEISVTERLLFWSPLLFLLLAGGRMARRRRAGVATVGS